MRTRCLIPALLLLATASLSAPAGAQSQLLFKEDFEAGLGAWAVTGSWHVTQPGDCGVGLTRTAKIGQNCGYGWSFERLTSPGINLPADADVIVSMDVLWDMDTAPLESLLVISLGNSQTGATTLYKFHAAEKGMLLTIFRHFDLHGTPPGSPWELTLSLTTDGVGNTGKGLFVDNIRIVTNAGTDLGYSEPSGSAPSRLLWWGELAPGSINVLSAEALPPLAPALLIAGNVLQPVLAQGILVNPAPLVVLPMMTPAPQDGSTFAAIEFPFVGPLLPPGTQVFLQLLTKDATGAWSASNTLMVVAP